MTTRFRLTVLLAIGLGSAPVAAAQSPATRCDSVLARLAQRDTTIRLTPPEPLRVFLPPENPPADLRGKRFSVRFSVDSAGRARVDTLSLPPINSSNYRAEFLKRLKNYQFAPATADGCRIPSTRVMSFTL